MKISDIIEKDLDVKEYVLSNYQRYEDDEVEDVREHPIVIFNEEVYDGYSRLSKLYNEGEEYVYAYVNI